MTKYERLYTADEVDGMIARAKAAAAQPATVAQLCEVAFSVKREAIEICKQQGHLEAAQIWPSMGTCMNKDQITEMARESGPLISTPFDVWCERFAALVAAPLQERIADLYKQLNEAERELDSQYKLGMEAERNKLAAWMMAQGYATGHGDTMEGLLEELEREVGFKRAELWIKRINEAVLAEREACAKLCDEMAFDWQKYVTTPSGTIAACADAIRART